MPDYASYHSQTRARNRLIHQAAAGRYDALPGTTFQVVIAPGHDNIHPCAASPSSTSGASAVVRRPSRRPRRLRGCCAMRCLPGSSAQPAADGPRTSELAGPCCPTMVRQSRRSTLGDDLPGRDQRARGGAEAVIRRTRRQAAGQLHHRAIDLRRLGRRCRAGAKRQGCGGNRCSESRCAFHAPPLC